MSLERRQEIARQRQLILKAGGVVLFSGLLAACGVPLPALDGLSRENQSDYLLSQMQAEGLIIRIVDEPHLNKAFFGPQARKLLVVKCVQEELVDICTAALLVDAPSGERWPLVIDSAANNQGEIFFTGYGWGDKYHSFPNDMVVFETRSGKPEKFLISDIALNELADIEMLARGLGKASE